MGLMSMRLLRRRASGETEICVRVQIVINLPEVRQ